MKSAASGGGITHQGKARWVWSAKTRLTALWPRLVTGLRRGGWWLLTLPVRLLRGWARDAWDTFQRRGYLLLATLVAAYVGLYSVMEARHERRANRALFERANFMTMVASGHRGTFITAMKTFGAVQRMTVPGDPELLDPRTWFTEELPNAWQLWSWAYHFFPLCTADTCGEPKPDAAHAWRINLRGAELRYAYLHQTDLRGAKLTGADLYKADLHRANLEGADLRGADLRFASLHNADLRATNLEEADLLGADLRGAGLRRADLGVTNLEGADLRGADLRGTNLQLIDSLKQEQLNTACVDDATQLSDDFTRPPPCGAPDGPISGPAR